MESRQIILKNDKNIVISDNGEKIYCIGDIIIKEDDNPDKIYIKVEKNTKYDDNKLLKDILNNNNHYYELSIVDPNKTFIFHEIIAGVNNFFYTFEKYNRKWRAKIIFMA